MGAAAALDAAPPPAATNALTGRAVEGPMVATDTVVGIVGAVVLVAVMVGVFVYEYNNTAPAPTEPPRTFLDPDGDIDGDGDRKSVV